MPSRRQAGWLYCLAMNGPVADVTERLMAKFEGRLALSVVSAPVRAADRDLIGSPAGARSEMLERCARQRRLDACTPDP